MFYFAGDSTLGLQLTIIFIVDYFINESMSCFVYKMSENGKKCGSVFPKVQDNVLKCLVLSQPKDIQFTVTEEERNQEIFTLKKRRTEEEIRWMDSFWRKRKK